MALTRTKSGNPPSSLKRTKKPSIFKRTRFKKKNPPAKPAWFSRKGWLRRKARLLLTKMSRKANRRKK